MIYDELEREKEIALFHSSTNQNISQIERNTVLKFNTIKTHIINISFSLNEICKSI